MPQDHFVYDSGNIEQQPCVPDFQDVSKGCKEEPFVLGKHQPTSFSWHKLLIKHDTLRGLNRAFENYGTIINKCENMSLLARMN